MPDGVSIPVNVTTTSELFQPLAFGAGDLVAEATGFVKSILKVTVKDAELPARSVHVLLLVWFAPGAPDPPNVGLQPPKGTPEPPALSLPWKMIKTPVLFQPLLFGAGIKLALTVGAVLSMLMLFAVALLVLPERLYSFLLRTGWSRQL